MCCETGKVGNPLTRLHGVLGTRSEGLSPCGALDAVSAGVELQCLCYHPLSGAGSDWQSPQDVVPHTFLSHLFPEVESNKNGFVSCSSFAVHASVSEACEPGPLLRV